MKYVIIIPDGCADEPQASLGGKTPLEAAAIPTMDEIAAAGVVGRANHVPPHLPAGSDVANLSLLGYDPNQYFTGRAPLEAAALGIDLGPDDWAIRCNLVTISDQIMKSFTAGQISSPEAARILQTVQERLGSAQLEFRPGVSYRNLLIYRGAQQPAPFSRDTRTTPPHDLTDKTVLDDYPRGPGSDLLNRLMAESVPVCAEHPVNRDRAARGELAATNIWLWGLGKACTLEPFEKVYGKRGAMITAVDLLRGLAVLMGWKNIEVPGSTGYLDTDYVKTGEFAVAALDKTDVLCVHIEATDEASHEGNCDAKINALEQIDRHIARPLLDALRKQGDFRILVTPDHPTPLRTKTHSHGFVPFAVCGHKLGADIHQTYDESAAGKSELAFADGWRLMSWFLETK